MAASLLAVCSCALVAPQQAVAFDFFGLFGTGSKPPPPSLEAISYDAEISGSEDKTLLQNLKDVSALVRLEKEPPADGESLVRRALADVSPLTETLWGSGYYDGSVTLLVGGIDVTRNDSAAMRAAATAEKARNASIVPVVIQVEPGQAYTLRDVTVRDLATGRPFSDSELPDRAIGLEEGGEAPTAKILVSEARIVDWFRRLGHPFARIVARAPVIDHPNRAVDMTFTVDVGPKAGLGTVSIVGSSGVDPAVVRSFIYVESGDPYSPQAVANIKKTVSGGVEALGSVRVREAKALDGNGNLPLEVEVADRPPRLVGFSARYSTTDGPGLKAYWAHRNLFGGGERLRIDADLYYKSRPESIAGDDKDFDWRDLGGKVSLSFVKPALWATRNDLLADLSGGREITDGYTSRWVNGTVAIRHRFSDKLSLQGGLEVERGQASDILGRIDYTLVGMPVSLTYDSTDNLLDPTRGVRLTASISPYPTFFGSTVGMVIGKAQGSVYYSIDEDSRYVLAARLGFGSILGADLGEIPANRRFYAGGGGSVRGYAYRSLSPQAWNGDPIGGRSLLEGSLEARIKVTDTIGIVPFFDFGTAFESSYPDFGDSMRYAAGIGLRYYTAIGPIRADVAFPLNKRRGDKPAVLYISLGQAF